VSSSQLGFIQKGSRVEIPIRGRPQTGYVTNIYEHPSYLPVKPITRILSDVPFISPDLFELALWLSRYYCTPLQNVFRLFTPPGLRKGMSFKEQLWVTRGKTKEELKELCILLQEKKPAQARILEVILPITKGILLSELLEKAKTSRQTLDALVQQEALFLSKIRLDRSPLINEEYFITKAKVLTTEQSAALQKIEDSLSLNKFETHLLYGITGSGKTEIYLQAIDKALQMNKSTIMLVPEISLTTQTIERFRSRFQEKIAVLHYRLSQGERHDEWHHIRSGKAKIVIGARSAIFSPVVNLGLIIVDEEHESSYKQNDLSPAYHARDVAIMRGKITQSTVILGSATPSLESYYNATLGKYTLSVLSQRPTAASLPKVNIVDMRKEYEKYKRKTIFSDFLLNQIQKRIADGEQTILFLNRRGYHTILLCPACEYAAKCPHCEVSLTYHLHNTSLACHLCQYQLSPPPRECPACKSAEPLKFRGIGTELIEKSLYAIFPALRAIRLDADTTRHKGSHQKLLRDFGAGKADILIGTQMIAKGLHFPQVTLVGILNSDAGLHIPDFRASENIFQLMTQVAGRAGRGVNPGEVVIQTALPENETIQFAAQQDYTGFYRSEIAIREAFNYPPFTQMAKLVFSGKSQKEVEIVAEVVHQNLLQSLPSQFELHPIVPCGYAKIKDQYRFQMLIRGHNMYALHQALYNLQEKKIIPRSIQFFVDINPSFTF
jgi:primosomal protein N' (replication factor Y)